MINVIIADDDDIFRNGLKIIIEQDKDIKVCGLASNGNSAYDLCKTENPDIVLMDMQMPVMNGLYATTAIRNMNSSEAHTIPIIAMTANAFKEDIEKCLNAGMNKYLSKPVDIFKLLKVLSEFRN